MTAPRGTARLDIEGEDVIANVIVSGAPAGMIYPNTGDAGSYTYRERIPLSELRRAFQKKYSGADLNLGSHTVVVHGVAPGAVPHGAESLPGVPAHMTVPILCGELRPSQSQ